VDVGFKVHRQDIGVSSKPESPSALHISFGQAF
jgi:hypothetical protein